MTSGLSIAGPVLACADVIVPLLCDVKGHHARIVRKRFCFVTAFFLPCYRYQPPEAPTIPTFQGDKKRDLAAGISSQSPFDIAKQSLTRGSIIVKSAGLGLDQSRAAFSGLTFASSTKGRKSVQQTRSAGRAAPSCVPSIVPLTRSVIFEFAGQEILPIFFYVPHESSPNLKRQS